MSLRESKTHGVAHRRAVGGQETVAALVLIAGTIGAALALRRRRNVVRSSLCVALGLLLAASLARWVSNRSLRSALVWVPLAVAFGITLCLLVRRTWYRGSNSC